MGGSLYKIVLARCVNEFAPARPPVRGMNIVRVPGAVMWKACGNERDLHEAREYAAAEGCTVFVYDTSERDPLGRAKAEILAQANAAAMDALRKTAR